MRIGTLFSGGLATPEQALKQMGKAHEVMFACEFDKFARQNYKANHQIEDEHFHIDVNDMDGKQYNGKVDVIVGGSPCQDFSIAGLRAGIEGKRGQLIWQYYRIIMEVQPEIFIYENVKGMMSDKNGQTIADFLQVFRESGYYCHHAVLNTKDYGVPQNRERVYIVGFKDHELYHRFQFADKIKLDKRLKDVLEDEVDEKYYLSDTAIKGFISHRDQAVLEPMVYDDYNGKLKHDGIACTLTVNCGASAPRNGQKVVLPSIKEETITDDSINLTHPRSRPDDNYVKVIGSVDLKGDDYIKRVYCCDGISPTIPTCQGGHQEPKIQVKSATARGYETATAGDSINLTHPDSKTRRGRVGVGVAQTLDCACNQAVVEPTINVVGNVYKSKGQAGKIIDTNGISVTVTGQRVNSQGYLNTTRIRKLTPRECFRLQGCDDTFKIAVSNSQAYKIAGNAMSVNILEMLFSQIDKAKNKEKTNTLMDFI